MQIHKLQYISQGTTVSEQITHIRQALAGGCRWIQLRWKEADKDHILEAAAEAKALCTAYEATLIINDWPEIAKLVDAHGVHLGLTDTSVQEARNMLGAGKIIGGTANTFADIQQRVAEKCDYVGLGPFRFTLSKAKLSPILGLEGYRDILKHMRLQEISIPLIGIGGIRLEDIPTLLQTGVHGIAVSGLITESPDKKSTIQSIQQVLHETPISFE